MSYNVNWDSIFPEGDPQNHDLRSASRATAFRRIVAAVQPDILCLQEINPERDPQQIGALLDEVLAPGGPSVWQGTSTRDSVIAARFPVRTEGLSLAVPAFPRELPQAAALVDLPQAVYGPLDVYVVCAHFKAGGNVYDVLLRQRQADVIMRQVGDALTPGGNLDLPAGTPLILLGDFNIYDTDPAEHLTTLLTGDIDQEDQYGPDVQPDWDGTPLADAQPSHNGLGLDFYTWRSDPSPLHPGRLDRVLYSDSVLAVEKAFILNTTLLSEAALTLSGLRADDVVLDAATGYYDHLPLVVDFAVVPAP
jgi:endonuclease/exonuclease/phosphatase family metal-dependent hydrolase